MRNSWSNVGQLLNCIKLSGNLMMVNLFGNHIEGLAQYCGNSTMLAVELPQSCAKALIWISSDIFHQLICREESCHHNGVIMGAIESQIISLTIAYSIIFFRRRSKKTSKLRVTGLCAGNSPGTVNSPHKWPVTRKMFPFDDVIVSQTKHMDYEAFVWKSRERKRD